MYIFQDLFLFRIALLESGKKMKCRIPRRKQTIEQLLNRLNLARMKSGTTQSLGARKCKILGESFLTMDI